MLNHQTNTMIQQEQNPSIEPTFKHRVCFQQLSLHLIIFSPTGANSSHIPHYHLRRFSFPRPTFTRDDDTLVTSLETKIRVGTVREGKPGYSKCSTQTVKKTMELMTSRLTHGERDQDPSSCHLWERKH